MWAKGIIMESHLGHKTKACGKTYFMTPVFLTQEGVKEWKWKAEMFDICFNAPTLVDACMALDIVPKSRGDIKLVRREGKMNDFVVPEPTCLLQLMKPRQDIVDQDWDPEEQVFILKGQRRSRQDQLGALPGQQGTPHFHHHYRRPQKGLR